MMEEDKNIPEGRMSKKKKEIGNEVRKNKFIFKTRRKINPEESKELRRTHGNLFDWVKRGRKMWRLSI